MQRFVLCLPAQALCRTRHAQRSAGRLYASKPSHGFRSMNPIGSTRSSNSNSSNNHHHTKRTNPLPSFASLAASSPLLYRLQVRLDATKAQYMRFPIVRWICAHAMSLATYQFVLDISCTAVLGILLYTERTSAAAIERVLERYRCPFRSWIDWQGGVYTEPVQVGPRALNPQKLTAAHTAYNITNGLFPLQVVFLVLTYPLLLRGWALWASRYAAPAVVAAAKTRPATAASSTRSATHVVRRTQQRSL